MPTRKHALYYPTSLGPDAPARHYLSAMQGLGWDVVHLTPGETWAMPNPIDYHWWVDYGEDSLDPIGAAWLSPHDGSTSIYVASDTHLAASYRFRRAMGFDYLFFNQRRAVEEYRAYQATHGSVQPRAVTWLPHAADPDAYPKFEIDKRFDVAFLGHLYDQPNYNGFTRLDVLDRLFREFPTFYFGALRPTFPDRNILQDAAHKLAQARIAINVSRRDDINRRVFETLSSGAFLLTNWLPTLGELFEDGVHLATYQSVDEAVDKARYYLAHPDEREQIAAAGHALQRQQHTYRHRVKTIFQIVGLAGSYALDASLMNVDNQNRI